MERTKLALIVSIFSLILSVVGSGTIYLMRIHEPIQIDTSTMYAPYQNIRPHISFRNSSYMTMTFPKGFDSRNYDSIVLENNIIHCWKNGIDSTCTRDPKTNHYTFTTITPGKTNWQQLKVDDHSIGHTDPGLILNHKYTVLDLPDRYLDTPYSFFELHKPTDRTVINSVFLTTDTLEAYFNNRDSGKVEYIWHIPVHFYPHITYHPNPVLSSHVNRKYPVFEENPFWRICNYSDTPFSKYDGYIRYQMGWNSVNGGEIIGRVLDHIPEDSMKAWIGKKTWDSIQYLEQH